MIMFDVVYSILISCKRRRCFKNKFLFPICIMQKVTILACTFMEIVNQMHYHKIGTNSELTYENGSI